MLSANKLEVNSMNKRPNLPRSLYSSKQITLDFVSNCSKRVSIDKTKVCKEYTHEDWTPKDLVDCYFCRNGSSICSLDFGVEPVVKVVSGWSVVDESEYGEGYKSLDVKSRLYNEELVKGE